MSEWQDIESAPKDWSDILLHDPILASDWRTVCEGYYDMQERVWKSVVFGVIEPTHWMPLPDGPK